MKEHDILKFLLLDIETATADPLPVRTEGGDQGAGPPEIIVSWDAERIPNYNGHTSYVGPIRDSSGNATGKEHHAYFVLNADVLVRHESELTRDQIADELHQHFVPYENDPGLFSEDTAQWDIGIAGPRNNSFVEPDWYEIGVPISFTYMKRAEVTDAGALPGTIENIKVKVNDRELVVADGEELTIASDETKFYDTVDVSGDLIIDGTVYTKSYTTTGTGSITVNGELIAVDRPYDEIETITSETLIS